MNAVFVYPFVLFAAALQAAGNSMNARLRVGLVNPWLAAAVSFPLIVFVLATLLLVMPTPLPSLQDLSGMPWWAPLGGLLFVGKVGAGPFNGLLITANLLTSLALDHFGWIGMPVHRMNRARVSGAVMMVAGMALIAFL